MIDKIKNELEILTTIARDSLINLVYKKINNKELIVIDYQKHFLDDIVYTSIVTNSYKRENNRVYNKLLLMSDLDDTGRFYVLDIFDLNINEIINIYEYILNKDYEEDE